MSKLIIKLSLDVTKLDKERFFKGKKGTYADIVVIHSPSDFGDFMLKQDCTKEERAARKEMPIIGNGKIISGSIDSEPAPRGVPSKQEAKPADSELSEDSIPF